MIEDLGSWCTLLIIEDLSINLLSSLSNIANVLGVVHLYHVTFEEKEIQRFFFRGGEGGGEEVAAFMIYESRWYVH